MTQENESNSSYLDDLLNFVDEQEAAEISTGSSSSIDSIDGANYAIKKLKQVRKEIADIKQTAQKQLNKFEERTAVWQEKTLAPYLSNELFLTDLIQNYIAEQLKGSKVKKMKLFEGTAGFTKQQDKFNYDDENLLKFLQENAQEYVKNTPSINKADLKKDGSVKKGKLYIGPTEVIGVDIVVQPDKFEIK